MNRFPSEFLPEYLYLNEYWTYFMPNKFIWKTSASPQTAEESLLFGGGTPRGCGRNWTEVSHRMKFGPLRFDKIEPQI